MDIKNSLETIYNRGNASKNEERKKKFQQTKMKQLIILIRIFTRILKIRPE